MIDLAKIKTLIVDDHFLARQFMSGILSEYHITRMEAAEDGMDARNLIEDAHKKGDPFNIVFLDWSMPRLNGLEVLRYFRARPEYASTAFIMVTAESDQDKIMTAIKAGATAYIIKPITKIAIAQKLKDLMGWLEKHQAKRA